MHVQVWHHVVNFSSLTIRISTLILDISPVFCLDIKASKTDHFYTGLAVVLAATGCDLCHARALLDYSYLRQQGTTMVLSLFQAAITFNLVFLSLHMPGVDGDMFSLIAMINELHWNCNHCKHNRDTCDCHPASGKLSIDNLLNSD